MSYESVKIKLFEVRREVNDMINDFTNTHEVEGADNYLRELKELRRAAEYCIICLTRVELA